MFAPAMRHRPPGRVRRRARDDAHRPRAGAADDRAAADEDGRRRGAVHDAEGRSVLALRGRAVRAATRRARRSTSRSRTGSRSSRPTRGTGTVEGINDLNRAYQAKYGPGKYAPIVGVTYWTFRIMTGIGFLAVLLSGLGLLAAVEGPSRARRDATCACRARDRAADPCERGRLDLHRDGPPAMGRAGSPARPRTPSRRASRPGRSASRSPASRSSTACSPRSTAG